MNTVTLTYSPKSAFARVAKAAVTESRSRHAIIRFEKGGQVYQVSPKTALQTVLWVKAVKHQGRGYHQSNLAD